MFYFALYTNQKTQTESFVPKCLRVHTNKTQSFVPKCLRVHTNITPSPQSTSG